MSACFISVLCNATAVMVMVASGLHIDPPYMIAPVQSGYCKYQNCVQSDTFTIVVSNIPVSVVQLAMFLY